MGNIKIFLSASQLLKIPILKRGPIHIDSEGNLYFANFYSSLLMGFKEDGTQIFAYFEPPNIPLPEVKAQQMGNIISSKPERSIQLYLSLTSDSENLYALFSGEEIKVVDISFPLNYPSLRMPF